MNDPMNRPARNVLAEAIGDELGLDNSDALLAVTDRVLVRLFLHGYLVAATPEDDDK